MGLADFYPFEPGSLTTAANASELFDRYPIYAGTLRWLDDVITRPDERLGRRGALCPRVRPALRANTLWLVAIRTSTSATEEAVEKCQHLPGLFTELAGQPSEAGDSSLLALFPDVAPSSGSQFIDRGHAALRMQFVAAGLMLGEFHPLSTVASVRNPDLLVMRAPFPMFAVRALTLHDLMFLDRPGTPPGERLAYLRHFEHHLTGRLGTDQHQQVAAAIAAAEAAL